VLGVSVLLVVGTLALEMSGRAPRIAATDHTNPIGFVAGMQHGQELCQPAMELPSDAQRVEVLIGTYGPPVPAVLARFVGPKGSVVASGRLAAGARQGYIRIPLSYPHGPNVSGALCLRMGSSAKVALAGDQFPAGPESEQIAGKSQPGRIDVVYLRPGRESWWQLLSALTQRFGLGKASFFGGWTFPAMVLLLVGVWVAVVRLLVRELT
jgi:hypothetical protein